MTSGTGLTVATTVWIFPVHVNVLNVYLGAMVYVMLWGVPAVFVNVCTMVVPFEAVAPVTLALTEGVQLNETEELGSVVVVKAIFVGVAEQIVSGVALTFGLGCTVIT